MLFNSFQFLLFFPIVTIIYFLLPHRFRWFHLLVASCIFYMAYIPVYILILFFTIVIDYYAGILIENAPEEKKQRFLYMSVIANVGVLAFFKYYNFFIDNINQLLHISNTSSSLPLLNIILPIGLSFHTFQAMSYTIEVYRENQKAERNFGIYALYVMFYPQLVAGPIERPQNILHQFYEKHNLDYDNVAKGIRQMLWGLIKKIVIADRLLLVTDPVFNHPAEQSGLTLAIGCIFFTFQVYCDFSGYSDIAIGCAKVMGFDLMTNFNRPFASKSISEFWRRWHISLSTWFFDYLFNPLVATLRRWRKWAIVFGLMLTFILSGFWHGASWNFIFWGLMYGVALVYEFYSRDLRIKYFGKLPISLANGISIFFTFGYVAFASVFFRSNTLKDSFFIIKKFGSIPSEIGKAIATKKFGFLNLPNVKTQILPCVMLILALEIIQYIYVTYKLKENFKDKPAAFRWAVYYSGLAALLFLGVYEKHSFIYFQF